MIGGIVKSKIPYDNLFSVPECNWILGGPPDRTYATLRIYQVDLDPDELTRLFSVTPSGFQVTGKPFTKRPKYVAKIGGWFLTTKDRCKSLDYSDHVEWILNQVGHCRNSILELQSKGYEMEVAVKVDFGNCNPTPGLSAAVIKRLAAFNLSCWFDVYV
jgi:hypothetical protein